MLSEARLSLAWPAICLQEFSELFVNETSKFIKLLKPLEMQHFLVTSEHILLFLCP